MQPGLIEKLSSIANAMPGDPMPECLRSPNNPDPYAINDWGQQLSTLAQEALDEILRLQALTLFHSWELIETAPVEPPKAINPYTYKFHCLLQSRKGLVFEGNAHYVQFSRSKKVGWMLRWYNAAGYLCDPTPILWMPLPAPREVPLS